MRRAASCLSPSGSSCRLHSSHRGPVRGPIIAVGEYAGTYITDEVDFWFAETPVTSSWTGSGEVFTVYYPNVGFVAWASLLAVTPGVFDYTVVVDWSNHYLNDGIASELCRTTNVYPAAFTVVDVTNVTASAYHVAEGEGPVTLTAQMTPVNAPDKVFWEIVPGQGGGGFSTNWGLTTLFYFGGGWSSNVVAARCGTSSREVLIHIYRVTGITATPQPAVAGQPITLTAITEPAGCPLPITWNISTNTGASITNTFGPGTHTVIASLGAGTITQTLDVVSVGVKEILYEWPANSDNWLPWSGLATGVPPLPTTAAVAVGSSFRVKAMPEPEGAEFPAGWPVWSGAAGGSGPIATATFASVSTNLSDYQSVTATSGTSSRTEQAVVFGIDSILVATNHVAIGPNTLTLTPQMTPVTGGEHLVVWDCTNATLTIGSGASVEFPTDQAGVFTVTATCGGSAASTNLFVYRLARIATLTDPVGEGDPVGISVTTEPTGCPLPVIWNVTADTNLSITVAFAAGTHSVIASLGTPESATQLTVNSVGVLAIQYEASPNSGNWSNWPAQPYFPKAVGFRVKALPKPAGATFPAGKPVWGGDASGTNEIGEVAWGSVSTNLGDLRLVTASSSTSSGTSVTNTAVVYEFDRHYEPEHKFQNRATNKFGVGEVVKLTAAITPTNLTPSTLGFYGWEVQDAGDGELDGATSAGATYHGPASARTAKVSLSHESNLFPGRLLTKPLFDLEFVAPQLTFEAYTTHIDGSTNVVHVPGTTRIGAWVILRVGPPDVSWKWVEIEEIGQQPAVVTGWYEFITNTVPLAHTNTAGRYGCMRTSSGWVRKVHDQVESWLGIPGIANEFGLPPLQLALGTVGWKNIPWWYHVRRKIILTIGNKIREVDQISTIEASGALKIEKGEAKVYSHISAPFSQRLAPSLVDLDP